MYEIILVVNLIVYGAKIIQINVYNFDKFRLNWNIFFP